MNNRNRNLNSLLNGMSGDFERSNFENSNNFTEEEIQIAQTAVRQRNGIVKHIGAGDNSGAIAALVAQSVGDLNLTVTREGVNIDYPLPFVLFGSSDYTTGYLSTIRAFLTGIPGTPTLVVSQSNTTGDVLFTYTVGENSDVVRVANLGNVNYAAFLAQMNQNYFKTKYVLVSISNEAYNLTQFAQPLFYGLLSALGMKGANQLVFRSRTNSWQFRKDRVEVVMPEQEIVPDFSFVMSIIQIDDFAIGFDFFMSDRVNLNTMNRR